MWWWSIGRVLTRSKVLVIVVSLCTTGSHLYLANSICRPQLYGEYGFVTTEVDECLELTARAIVISAWLAATARRELARFAEFITFLRAGGCMLFDL